MIVTKRTRIPDNMKPEDFEKVNDQLIALAEAAKNDKVNVITNFLFGDKEEYDDVTDDDFKSVKFLGTFCNEDEG